MLCRLTGAALNASAWLLLCWSARLLACCCKTAATARLLACRRLGGGAVNASAGLPGRLSGGALECRLGGGAFSSSVRPLEGRLDGALGGPGKG